ncbi:MAG: 30S ribosomal protein S17 [Verrucomicrobiales bacterium]
MSESENPTKPGLRKTRVGIVTSDAMEKTIVVEVKRRVPHPLFKKIVNRSSKFLAHDETGEAAVGDRVMIEETKPRSKRKCWELKEVLSH